MPILPRRWRRRRPNPIPEGAVRKIRVGLRFDEQTMPVGTLSHENGEIRFRHEPAFLRSGLDLSPLRLRRRRRSQTCEASPFRGLHGVFADSLPDRWGHDLLEQAVPALGGDRDKMAPLDLLGLVGDGGMGALVYEPDGDAGPAAPETETTPPARGAPLDADDLDRLAETAHMIERNASIVDFQRPKMRREAGELLRLAGSVGGARPKILVGVDGGGRVVGNARRLPAGFEPWILKLQNPGGFQEDEGGAIEQAYALAARDAGLSMPPTRLIPSGGGLSHFAVKRFDRTDGGARLHMHTAAGLLHQRIGLSAMDYADLVELTLRLTLDGREAERMVRLAVFNVLACNRDDHGKNFSFLMDRDGKWTLSPVYDLTFCPGLLGLQCTTVMGEGDGPTRDAMLRLAAKAGLTKAKAEAILERTRAALAGFETAAKEQGVSDTTAGEIAGEMRKADRSAKAAGR